MLTLVAATLLVGAAAGAFVARLELPLPLDRALGFVTAALGLAALAPLVAAVLLGALTPNRVLAAAAMFALVSVLAAGPARVASAWRGLRRAHPSVRRPTPLAAAVVLAALIALGWRLYAALVLPPYAYDALTYHLTMVASWLDQRTLDPTPLSLCCSRYPATGELYFTWPALFTGTDAAVDVVQIVFALVAAAATGGIAHALGARGSNALVTAGLFMLTPVVLAQTTTNYVDVVTVAGMLVASYFTVRYLQAEPFGGTDGVERPALLVPAGIGAGIALGTKVTGVLVLVALVGLVAVRLALARDRLVAPLAALVVPAVALGGFWYARNLVDTGNPVHPIEVEVLGVELFSGPVELDELLTVPVGAEDRPWPVQVVLSWARDLAPWVSADDGYSYEQRLGGLGPLWVYLGAGLTLLVAGRAVSRRRWSSELDFFAPLAVVFVLQPYQWWSRFTIFLAAAACVAVALTLERLQGRARAVLGAAALGLALVGAWFATVEINPAGGGNVLGARELVRLRGAPSEERTIGGLFFEEYAWVDDLPPDAVVGVELGERVRFVYPLFGPELDRKVVRLAGRSRANFRRRLRAAGIEFALVARGGNFDAWLEGLPVVHEDERSRAYRVTSARIP